MRFLGICAKYFLWSIFSIIIFLLLVGLAKSHWNVSGYVNFLNTNDWSLLHLKQVSTWADPFWPAVSIEENVSIEAALADDIQIDAETGSLDVYDPIFEEELNTIFDEDSLSGKNEDFGFVTDK